MLSACSPVPRDEERPRVFVEHTLPHSALRPALRGLHRVPLPSAYTARQHPDPPPGRLVPVKWSAGSSRNVMEWVFKSPSLGKKDAGILNADIEAVARVPRNSKSPLSPEQVIKKNEARKRLDEIVPAILRFGRHAEYTRNRRFQCAVIINGFHRNGTDPDHLQVVFTELEDEFMKIQVWKDVSSGMADKCHACELTTVDVSAHSDHFVPQIYRTADADEYGRDGDVREKIPVWKPAYLRVMHENEHVPWLKTMHAQVMEFHKLEGKLQYPKGERTLLDLANVARESMRDFDPTRYKQLFRSTESPVSMSDN